MEDVLVRSIDDNRHVASTAYDRAMQLKAEGIMPDLSGGSMGFVDEFRSQSKMREGYAANRGWLYSAVHALASKAAGQCVNVGRMGTSAKSAPKLNKAYLGKVPSRLRSKAATQELEILVDHPLIDALEHPNPLQHRWQFVHSFVSSLNLTGWGYIVAGTNEDDRLEFYSLPTSWVKPNADFTKFRIVDPSKPDAGQGESLTRDNVAFAYFPDPGSLKKALAPAASQMAAIKVDEKIQASQAQFFDNAVFPSALVTVGTNPMNDKGTPRPVISPAQRRQIHLAINRIHGGTRNYGRPIILDGIVEKVEKYGATENEIGWTKSEDKVKRRILSAFGISTIILGEEVAGSYAQAYVMKELFFDKVNTHLDMLDVVMADFVKSFFPGENLDVWWEPAKAVDPSIESKMLQFARKNRDISQNELRAEMGLPPDEDGNEANITGSMGNQVVSLLAALGKEEITSDQLAATLMEMGLSTSSAERIAGQPSAQALLRSAVAELGRAMDELSEPITIDHAPLLCCEGIDSDE